MTVYPEKKYIITYFSYLDSPLEKKPPEIGKKPLKVMEKTPPKRDMDYW